MSRASRSLGVGAFLAVAVAVASLAYGDARRLGGAAAGLSRGSRLSGSTTLCRYCSVLWNLRFQSSATCSEICSRCNFRACFCDLVALAGSGDSAAEDRFPWGWATSRPCCPR